MSEIDPVDEIAALVYASQPRGELAGHAAKAIWYDQLEQRGLVTFHEGNLGPMATITPAGKARLKKLVDQLTRSVPNV